MNTNEVAFIVDKIAEKLSVATDKIQPIAEETLRQYQTRELLYAQSSFTISLLFFLIAIIIFILGLNSTDKDNALISIVPLVLFIGSFVIAVTFYGHYLAPIPSIFGF
mgnify:CR=1 FL=1